MSSRELGCRSRIAEAEAASSLPAFYTNGARRA